MIGRKYPISHRFRVFTLLLVMLAAAASTVFLIAFGLIGVTVEAPETKAVYSSVSEILCDLDMAYDPLYNENALEFGDGYAARFVDAAVLSFLYRFDCTDAFDFGGSYSVSAVLEAGYDNSLIWKKQYLLIPESPLTGGQVSEGLRLPLKEYRDMAAAISANTGIGTSAVMTVRFTVNATAVAGGVPVSDTLVSTLVFDLSKDVLVPGGEPKQERTVAVEAMGTREPVHKATAVLLSSLLLFFSLLAGVFLWYFTYGFQEDPVQKMLRRLFKRYGSRMAALYPGSGIARRDTIFLKSFQDLLLTSNVLKKPILCCREGEELDAEFYVIGDFELYCFRVDSLGIRLSG